MPNDVYNALAHPIRRRIVERLAESPATVGDATHKFGVSKPTISGHLKVLEEAGVVVRVIEGRTHRLRLDGTRLNEASVWLERQRALWTRAFDAVEGLVAEQKEGEA
jgi:DNA-binding transcriptional ArsR family regulator